MSTIGVFHPFHVTPYESAGKVWLGADRRLNRIGSYTGATWTSPGSAWL